MSKYLFEGGMKLASRIVLIIFGVIYVIRIATKDVYSSPAWLTIISLGIAVVYILLISLEKIYNPFFFYDEIRKSPNEWQFKIISFIFYSLTFISIIVTLCYLYKYQGKSLTSKQTDICGIIILLFTVCANLISDLLLMLFSIGFVKSPKKDLK